MRELQLYEERPSIRRRLTGVLEVGRRLRSDRSGAVGAGAFIAAVVTVVIALALLPVVMDFVNDSSLRANLTSTQLTLLDLVPTFYLIGVFVGLIAWLAITRRT